MAQANATALPDGQSRISGRIDSVRRKTSNGQALFLTLLALPAVDRFSHPDTVEVISSERLGNPGDEVSCLVRVGGYPRRVQPKDAEQAAYKTADNVLRVVHSA